MYSAEFDYYRAGSVAEASDLLKKHPGAKLLAGGHSLIPLLKLRLASPTALIDIGRIAELKGITVSDGTIRIGPLTTHAELAASPVAPRAVSRARGRGCPCRRSGRAKPGHDWWQRGSRGSRFGSANGARGRGRADDDGRARRPPHG